MINWQKCPVCNGHGRIGVGPLSENCSVCEGYKIISTLNGAPPSFKQYKVITKAPSERDDVILPPLEHP